ncbi:NUDIX hydrolase [Patescibacteria group bacterium]|nr:NUDIX hydrolase [Patescibacteria group bacterium]
MDKVKVVGVYIEKDDRILLVQEKGQSLGLWSIPLGHVDPEESLEESAIRETKEETGYTIKIIRKLESKIVAGSEYKGGEKDNDKIIELNFFEGEIIGGELKIDKEDLLDVKWFTKDDIKQLPLRGDWLKALFSLN